MRLDIVHKPLWLVLAAVLGASSVWLYAERMVSYQIAGSVRGNCCFTAATPTVPP
jgi:hypothetical protein